MQDHPNFSDDQRPFCYIHSCTLANKGTKRLEHLINTLIASKLIDQLAKIVILNIGIPISGQLGDRFEVDNYSDNPRLYEIPTINRIRNHPINQPILYIHTKGISYNDDYQQENDWIDMMLYFLINRSTDCLEHLKTVDVVGCNYSSEPRPHFSGNFWWANAEYLRRLPKLPESGDNKMDAEMWLFQANPKYYQIHSSGINHFVERYPPERYVNT